MKSNQNDQIKTAGQNQSTTAHKHKAEANNNNLRGVLHNTDEEGRESKGSKKDSTEASSKNKVTNESGSQGGNQNTK